MQINTKAILPRAVSLSLLMALSVFSFGCASNGGGPQGQTTGMMLGAILGGIAGSQVGDGSSTNVLIGAVLGGVAGAAIGSRHDEYREALRREEAQRRFEYEQEMEKQARLEREIEALEEQRIRDALAREATDEDVALAEAQAQRVERDLAARRAEFEASQERAKRIQEARERIEQAQRELDEIEARESGEATQ